jgi:hypothetical protein
MLGFLGLWLGSRSQFWLGLTVFLFALAGVVVMSHLDLRATEQERRIRWKRIREYGKLRYVVHQVLRGWPVILFLLALDLSNTYQSGERWNPRFLTTFFAFLVGGNVLISLGWWYWQERKYGNVSY